MKRTYLQVVVLALILLLWLPAAAAGTGSGRQLSLQLGCQLRDTAWVHRVTCPRYSDTPEAGITFINPGSTDFFRYWSEFASGGGGAAVPSGGVVLLHLRRGGQPGVHLPPSLKDFLIELGDF